MPKKAPKADEIDPVRSRLAGSVAAPAPKPVPQSIKPRSSAPDVEAVEVATKKPSSPVSARRKPVSTRMTINRKFMITEQEADQMEDTLRLISKAFGGKVTYSQVSRALWTILAGREDVFKSVGRRSTKRTPPSTGDALGMAEYEEEVAEFLEAVMRRP